MKLARYNYIVIAVLFLAFFALAVLLIWTRVPREILRDDAEAFDVNIAETYHIPSFSLGSTAPQQDRLLPKLGGLPWGFPIDQWPSCEVCGHAMSHLAQLPHIEGIVELGEEDAVLHVFQCENDPGECGMWGYNNGSSRCIILELQMIGEGLTSPREKIPLIGEYRITKWTKRRTLQELLDHPNAWYDQDGFYALGETVLDDIFSVDTKVQGVPHWTGNGPHGFPSAPFEYLAQFGTFLFCDGKIPTADEAGTTIRFNKANPDGTDKYVEPKERRDGASYLLQVSPDGSRFYGDWANLGSDGTGYLFIDRTKSSAEVVWFWNR